MKNNFLLPGLHWLAIALFFPFLSTAQSSLAIQGGINLSNATIIGSTPFIAAVQGNFLLGCTIRNPLGERWAIAGDAQYTRRGFYLYTVNIPESRTEFRLNYLDVGAKIEYNVFKNVYLQWGGYFGYRTQEYVRANGSGNLVTPAYALTQPWDVGLQGGIAAYFRRWSAFVRYEHGLKAASELTITDENGATLGSLRLYNRGLQVGVGYGIFSW